MKDPAIFNSVLMSTSLVSYRRLFISDLMCASIKQSDWLVERSRRAVLDISRKLEDVCHKKYIFSHGNINIFSFYSMSSNYFQTSTIFLLHLT